MDKDLIPGNQRAERGDLFGKWRRRGARVGEVLISVPWAGNAAVYDLAFSQGTILVLALFFVFLNLVVDVFQAAIDPRIKRA